jgi:cytochrome P450
VQERASTAAIAPGPPSRLPGGSLLAFSRDPLGFLTQLEREHGEVARFRGGGRDVFLLSHPELIHQVLVAEQRSFCKDRGLEMTKALLGDGLLTSEGELHRRQRRLVQPALHADRIARYAAAMARRTRALASGWRDGQLVDVGREMMGLALGVVAETLFGADVAEEEVAAIGAALDEAMSTFTMARIPFHALLERLPLPSTRRLRRARAVLDAVVRRMIAARRAAEPGDDLLSTLLAARDGEGGAGMSEAQLRDEVMTVFLAGHETTASALTWTFHLLGRNPGVEALLHAELEAVLGARPPEPEDLPRLVWTERIVTEAMRLYPSAWTLARRALVPVAVRGYRIAPGSTVLLSPWVMHRHPRWFDEPLRFDPGRWTARRREALPRFVYFPFGAGPRACIGERFAWAEAELALATVAGRWRLEPADDREVAPVARVTLRPGRPVRAIARPRGGGAV